MQETPSSLPQTTTRRRSFATPEALTSLAFFLFLWYFWGVRYGDYLYAAQENSLFLFDGEYLARWLQVPEGALCYATAFLSQFFYYPILGGLILATLAVACQILLARLANLKGVARILSFLPSCFVAVSTTWPAYYIFIPYNQPMVFSESLAILVSLGGFAFYKVFEKPRFRVLVGVALVVVLYPLFGFWGVFATALCCVQELGTALTLGAQERSRRREAVIDASILALAAVSVPFLWRRAFFSLSVKPGDVFYRGLLEDVRYDKDSLTARVFYGCAELAPLLILTTIFGARFLAGWKEKKSSRVSRRETRAQTRAEAKKDKKKTRVSPAAKELRGGKNAAQSSDGNNFEEKRGELKKRRRVATSGRLLWELLIVLMACVFLGAYHSRSFFIVLKQARALGLEDWEEILLLEAKDPFPVNAEVQMRNLALFYAGRLPERAFERPIAGLSTLPVTGYDYAKALGGDLICKAKLKLFSLARETQRSGDRALCELLYCYWGQTNIAARIAMNNLIASEDRSISSVRTLAIAALANGESELARRYLRVLSRTLFYKDWAEVRLAFVDSPDFYDGVRDYHDDKAYGEARERRIAARECAESVAEAAERRGVALAEIERAATMIRKMRAMRPVVDYTTTLGYPNLVFLYKLAREEEFDESPRERQDLILIAALMEKKGDVFLELVEPLLRKEYPNGGAPKAYEQGYAMFRYQKYGRDKWRDCDYKFSRETIELFGQFVEFVDTIGEKSNISSDEVQETIRNYCRGLYWGYAVDESLYRQF